LEPIIFDWTGHGGKMSWGSTLSQAFLVGVAILIAVLCVIKRRQIKARIGKFMHNLHDQHQKSLQVLEGEITKSITTNPPNSGLFIFGPSGRQVQTPVRQNLYPVLENVDLRATTEEESWE
jgi:hypothetical protein